MVGSILKFSEQDPGIEVESFSDEEAADLDKVVTNVGSSIYAWKINDDLTPEQSGALLSRYSRTTFTGKRLYLKEFLPNRERGREFFESWLVDYGDDSIQEMAGGLPLSCEFVSNLAAKDIEDARLGSYIEKSTRYVFFDKKLPNGEFMFYKDPNILGSRFGDRYLDLMHGLFNSYVSFTDKMAKHIEQNNPYENQKFRIGDAAVTPSELDSAAEEKYGVTEKDLRKSYDNAIKANALDFMRDYLPMATLTHIGMSMNARSYENLIMKMGSSPLAESRWISRMVHSEISKTVPSLLKRVNDKHGDEQRRFFSEKNASALAMVEGIERVKEDYAADSGVELAYYTGKGLNNPDLEAQLVLASMILYKFGKGYSMSEARRVAEGLGEQMRKRLINAYVGKRTNRRHKPGRAFENIEYLLDFTGRIGIYRDIQRHRIGTQERQNFTVRLGYNTRREFVEIGIDDDYRSKMAEVVDLYKNIEETMPYQAQYVVTFGFNIRWYYRFNARQLFHFAELRTTPGGHPDYRRLVQDAYAKIKAVHPTVAEQMMFINLDDKKLGRLDSEIRIAQKKRAIGVV